MKLWLVSATAVDYEPYGLFVAENEEKAIEKFKKSMEEDSVWYGTVYAEVIEVVDGYGIEIIQS